MRSPLTLIIACALAAFLVVAGCGDSDEPASTAPTEASSNGETTASASGDGEGAEIYFTAGEQFRKVERDLPEGGSEVEAAAEALLRGPTGPESSGGVETGTQIPAGTELRDVSVDEDGTAVVEVSPEFVAGVPADPAARSRAEDAELDARLGQVTYTLTQFPEVKEAKVVAGDEAVEPKPTLAREDFAKPAKGPKRLARPKGERSSGVRALQERLAELRYLPKRAVDGVDGYRTTQAVIAFQSWRGLERDGIVGPQTKAALAKASPPKPKNDGPSKRIEVFREKGVALLVKGGKTRRAIHVSTGGPGNETPTGSYEVFRKELKSWSVPFQTWLPYASYFNNGIAFHEYPDVPTYPASHGCVRAPSPEAKGVYKFAALGTAVIVY